MKRTPQLKRQRRKQAIRKRLAGTAEVPRVFVFRSNKYIYVGAADDTKHKVIMSQSAKKGVASAKKLGEAFGKALAGKKIKSVVFDRSGYKYHGQVAALAEGMRSAGINF